MHLSIKNSLDVIATGLKSVILLVNDTFAALDVSSIFILRFVMVVVVMILACCRGRSCLSDHTIAGIKVLSSVNINVKIILIP